MADNLNTDPNNLSNLLLRYAKNDLPNNEKHLLEKEAIDDPFLADAMEGMEQFENKALLNSTLAGLNNKVAGLTEQQPTNLKANKSTLRNTLAIAASFAVLIAGAYAVATLLNNPLNTKESAQSPSPQIQLNSLPPSTTTADSAAPQISIGSLSYASVTDSVMPYSFKWDSKSLTRSRTDSAPLTLAATTPLVQEYYGHADLKVNTESDYYVEDVKATNEPAPPQTLSNSSIYDTYGPASNNNYSRPAPPKVKATDDEAGKADELTAKPGVRKEVERTSGTEVVSGKVTPDGSIAIKDYAAPDGKSSSNKKPTETISGSTTYADAVSNFNNGNYKAAIKGFENELKANPTNDRALLYTALAYNNSGSKSKAITYLNKVPKSSALYENSLYEKARIYVADKNTAQAKLALTELINLNGSYKIKAQTMLDKLGK